MRLDFKKAILLPFSGKDWFLRLIVLSILSISQIGFHFVIYSKMNFNLYNDIIVWMILGLLFFGYFCQFAHNEFNNVSPSLPSWKLDFVKYLRQGFICSIGMFINLLILSALIVPFYALIQAIHGDYINYLSTVIYYQLFKIVTIYTIFMVPCFYAFKFRFKDMLAFKKNAQTFSNAKLEFLLCFAVFLISSKIISLLSLHIKPIYIQVILTSLILSIVYIVTFDLFIQTFKLSKQRYIELTAMNPNYCENTDIEKEISKWNWGAFFLGWLWGLFNKSYWALLTLIPIPFFGNAWAIICGIKGNEWAWKNKKWESIEQFKTIQRKWVLYGVIFWGIISAVTLLGMLAYNAK